MRRWILGARLRTLPAAVVPVIVGTSVAAGGGINGAAGVESSPPEGAVAMDAQHWLEHLDDNLPVNFAKPNTPVTATLLARQVSLSCSMLCCTVAASHISPVTDSFITIT